MDSSDASLSLVELALATLAPLVFGGLVLAVLLRNSIPRIAQTAFAALAGWMAGLVQYSIWGAVAEAEHLVNGLINLGFWTGVGVFFSWLLCLIALERLDTPRWPKSLVAFPLFTAALVTAVFIALFAMITVGAAFHWYALFWAGVVGMAGGTLYALMCRRADLAHRR